MRRRLRQQTRIREALLVDLGALVYELHRHGRREPELLQAKASELTVVDQEVRALADALGAGESVLALVAAGVAGSCEHCGTLLSTDARYCSGCGAEAAPSLPGSPPPGPAAGAGAPGAGIGGGTASEPEGEVQEPLRPSEHHSDPDPEATGVIGRRDELDPGEPGEEPPPAHEEAAEAHPGPELEPEEPDPELEPDSATPGEPAAPAPWLSDEDRPVEADTREAAPSPAADPEQPPATARRRRSGGAVGKVAGALRRTRDGG
jgi:hypothetical protein